MRQVTLKEIAERAGVSKPAASAALSGRAGTVFVSEATRLRVKAIADELGYTPNGAARALVTGKTHVVEFWSQNVNNPFFNAVFHAARQRLVERDYSVVLFETAMPRPSHALPAWPADGVLVFDFMGSRVDLERMLAARGFTGRPSVTAGSYYLHTGDHVAIDFPDAVGQAVEHLRATGCRRIGYLVDRASRFPQEVRYSAFMGALGRLETEPEVVEVQGTSRAAARAGIRSYVQDHGCPDGLLCHNDLLAVGAYRGLCDLGIKVPDDVRIVGCDGIEEVEYLECPLTTIVQPIEEMCARACDFLLARIADPSLPQQKVSLPLELVVRRSTAG